MVKAQRFPFIEKYDQFGVPEAVPALPLTLSYGGCSLQVVGLLDTGASVNVLPYDLGLQLGAVWNKPYLCALGEIWLLLRRVVSS